MEKNEIYDIKITDMTEDGAGIGHIDGMAVFVKDSAVGDEARIKIIKVKKTYAYGRIETLISPSKDRVEPACPVARQCGGCTLQHLSYYAELELKKKDKKYVEKNNKDESFRYHISLVEEKDDSLDEEPVITNEDFVIGIRPEFIELDEGEGGIEGELYGVMPTGMESTIKIAVGNFLLTGVVFGSKLFQIGAKHNITVSGDGILLFDRKSGKCIASGSLELR